MSHKKQTAHALSTNATEDIGYNILQGVPHVYTTVWLLGKFWNRDAHLLIYCDLYARTYQIHSSYYKSRDMRQNN